ncbi:glucosyltransferase domain-containing protein [Paenibacillus sp. LjRoot153]|uniref:glucosyltransferase domain-containing protein n=1 Tax=Paenibacillus sp. LjRoot153 TaxID=3342270 RepID=UPI003ED08EC2
MNKIILKEVNNMLFEFINFLKLNKIMVLFVGLLMILTFGYEICNFTLSIDEEIYIFAKKEPFIWFADGRFGIAIFKWIFMAGGMFPPFFATAIASLFLVMSGLMWCYNIYQASNKNIKSKFAFFICVGLYISIPTVISEYMMYSSYNIEVGIGLTLLAISSNFVITYNKTKFKQHILFAIILLFCAFSIYQAFTLVFITSTCLFCICYLVLDKSINSFKDFLNKLFSFVIVFIIAIILYFITNKVIHIFYPSRGYLDNFNGWKVNSDITSNLYNVIRGIGKYYFYHSETGSNVFIVTFGVILLLIIYSLFIFNSWKKIVIPILFICYSIAPFLMNFIFAWNMPYRTMLSLLVLISGTWIIVISITPKKFYINIILYLMIFIILIQQVQKLNYIFYSDNLRYKTDLRISEEIMSEIVEMNGNKFPDRPIVFLGAYNPDNRINVIHVEDVGRSYFSLKNTHRLTFLLEATGYNVPHATGEQIQRANTYAGKLTNWPQKESIKILDDIVVVKLSDQ